MFFFVSSYVYVCVCLFSLFWFHLKQSTLLLSLTLCLFVCRFWCLHMNFIIIRFPRLWTAVYVEIKMIYQMSVSVKWVASCALVKFCTVDVETMDLFICVCMCVRVSYVFIITFHAAERDRPIPRHCTIGFLSFLWLFRWFTSSNILTNTCVCNVYMHTHIHSFTSNGAHNIYPVAVTFNSTAKYYLWQAN